MKHNVILHEKQRFGILSIFQDGDRPQKLAKN